MENEKNGFLIPMTGCSNDCIFCIKGKNYRVSNESIKKQEGEILKNIIKFKKEGITEIIISGSDSIEYPKIIQLVKYLKRQGFKKITIATHGKNLSEKNFAENIVGAGVDLFTLPIYGSKPEIHDSVTRVKGSFNATIKGIKNVKDLNIEILMLVYADYINFDFI